MGQPGFALQWKTTLDSPARQGVSLTQGVVTSGVNIFTPISTVAGPDNVSSRSTTTRGTSSGRGASRERCPRAPRRVPAGSRGRRRAWSTSCPPAGRRSRRRWSRRPRLRWRRRRTGRRRADPAAVARGGGGAAEEPAGRAAQCACPRHRLRSAAAGRPHHGSPGAPPSPFPTNPAAVAAAGGSGGGLFRSSGVRLRGERRRHVPHAGPRLGQGRAAAGAVPSCGRTLLRSDRRWRNGLHGDQPGVRRRAERHLGRQHRRRHEDGRVVEDQWRRSDRVGRVHDNRHGDRCDRRRARRRPADMPTRSWRSIPRPST